MKKKKLYLVKREVYATSVKSAISGKGIVYAVELADDKYQEEPPKKAGFNIEKNEKVINQN